MTEFRFKYWFYHFKTFAKATFPWMWFMVALIVLLDIAMIFDGSMDLANFFKSIAFFIFIYGIGAIAALILVALNAETEYVRYKSGFSLDYFYAFENKYIKGKPVNNDKYIRYAEIYRQLGDYKSAIAVLNTIRVDENVIGERSNYLFVYMMSAIQSGDIAMADDIWRRNQSFINRLEHEVAYVETLTMINLTLAYADAAAGRYSHALNIVRTVLNGKKIKKWPHYKGDYLALKIYLLKKLGKENEINSAVMDFNKFTAKWNPFFEHERNDLRESVEKAVRGEFPL